MSFEKELNTVLEGQTVQENYIYISPLEYSDAIIRMVNGDEMRGGKKYYYCEWYKVTNNKKSNLKYIKHELLPGIPQEVKNKWKKCFLLMGRDIRYHHSLEDGESFFSDSMYIVKYPKLWDKKELFHAYLKEAPFSADVKHVFGDLFKEL